LTFELLFRAVFPLCLISESIKDGDQQTVNKQYEREKQRLATGIEELRAKLTQIEAENSDLKVNMAHRTSQFQLIQEELLEKASNASKLENEVSLDLPGYKCLLLWGFVTIEI
jgi:hypothetical protein